jgi:hypothetical protein
MARQRDDDLGPALLALGALALGIVAMVAIWGLRGPTSARAREDRRREATEGRLEHAAWSGTAYADAGPGTGLSPFAGLGFELGSGLSPAEEENDPQVLAMRRSFSGGDAGMSAFNPYRSTGHATFASGVPGVARDAVCDLRVLPVTTYDGAFNCVVRVRCGGVVVYPDDELVAGYAPCEIERGVPHLATDEAPTARDGDPELLVDLDRRIARIRDLRRTGEDSLVEIRLD